MGKLSQCSLSTHSHDRGHTHSLAIVEQSGPPTRERSSRLKSA